MRDLFGNGAGGLNGGTVLNGTTVINDGAVNVVNGGLGMDWLWLEGATDRFSGEEGGEIVAVR